MTTREYAEKIFGEQLFTELDHVTPEEFTEIARYIFRDYLEDVKNGNDSLEKEYIVDVNEDAKYLNKDPDQVYYVLFDHYMGMPYVKTLHYEDIGKFRITMDNSMLNLTI